MSNYISNKLKQNLWQAPSLAHKCQTSVKVTLSFLKSSPNTLYLFCSINSIYIVYIIVTHWVTEANSTVAVLKERAVKTLLMLLQCNNKKKLFGIFFLFSFWLFCNFYLKGDNIKAIIRRCNRLACLSPLTCRPQPNPGKQGWMLRPLYPTRKKSQRGFNYRVNRLAQTRNIRRGWKRRTRQLATVQQWCKPGFASEV